jgi:AP-3 complex subunit beta
MNRLVGQGRYFESTNPKFEEIKVLLDNAGNKEKMEGMKRLLAMMSKGTDVSGLYPDVVKNVICKNMGVKKLVYMFLVHYAELEPDPALLAINNFQRDMQSDNQLLRALGLRVMSSIRLRVIVQVVVLAIRKAAKDSSPYVRKAAAHALPKVYSLDEEQLPDLLDILQSLMRDHSPMVLGSAFWAFNEICPERFDMLHPHFRKVCHLLADIDEWGQVATLNTLTRYARTQFKNPEAAVKVSSFVIIALLWSPSLNPPLSHTATGEAREEEEQAIVARGFGQL